MIDFLAWLSRNNDARYSLGDLYSAFVAGQDSERVRIVRFLRSNPKDIQWDDHSADVMEKLAKLVERGKASE